MRKEIEIVFVVIDRTKAKVMAVCSSSWGAERVRDSASHPDNVDIIKRTVRK